MKCCNERMIHIFRGKPDYSYYQCSICGRIVREPNTKNNYWGKEENDLNTT